MTEIRKVGDHREVVTVDLSLENPGTDARRAVLVVELSHTRADGSISRARPLLVPPETAGTITQSFRPVFLGGQPGRPEGASSGSTPASRA